MASVNAPGQGFTCDVRRYNAGHPEIAYGECDGCGRWGICQAGYWHPWTCQGECGTGGCGAVIVLCGSCGSSPWAELWAWAKRAARGGRS
jgi:hypothetical protein